jgi:hypothetical protein
MNSSRAASRLAQYLPSLSSSLHTICNLSCSVLDACRCVSKAAGYWPACASRCALECLTDSSSKSADNTPHSIRDAAHRVAKCRRDELDAGCHTRFLLTDRHGDGWIVFSCAFWVE